MTKKEEEERRIAEMGRPTLGEHVSLEVIVEESYEFKVGLSERLASAVRILLPAVTSCVAEHGGQTD